MRAFARSHAQNSLLVTYWGELTSAFSATKILIDSDIIKLPYSGLQGIIGQIAGKLCAGCREFSVSYRQAFCGMQGGRA